MDVEVGDTAPDFTLLDQDGTAVSLSALRGTPVLLYFYPKDDTPGCTRQACDIRDRWQEFEDAGIRVLGISPDDVVSHARFQERYDLPHTLLADPGREAIGAYGVWGTKVYGGREVETVIRSSVLIDREGDVARLWDGVRADEHADQVLAAADALDA